MLHPTHRWYMLSVVNNIDGKHTPISSAYEALAEMSMTYNPLAAIAEVKSNAVYQRTRGVHDNFSEMCYYVAEIEKSYVELWMKNE